MSSQAAAGGAQSTATRLSAFSTNHMNELGLIVIILLLYLVFGTTAHGFASINNQLTILRDVAAIAAAAKVRSERPRFIVARTVKGKGVSFMENQVGWHGKVPSDDDTSRALAELGA